MKKSLLCLAEKIIHILISMTVGLYVQTSRHEGFGFAIAEALILGKVVLSTDIECVREQIDDSINGYIEKMDVRFFADRIISIFSDETQMKLVSERATQTGQSGVAIEKILN